MDKDERDYDLVREAVNARKARATTRRHATAWDEPPEFYDDECSTCAGSGWECYGIGSGDPHFRECTTCLNPDNRPSP